MNKVMGGSLPARLWHDAMLAALDDRPSGSGAATVAARAEQPGEPRTQPLLPRERIESQFVERVTGAGNGVASAAPASTMPAPQRWLRAAREKVRELIR
jgi:hypothetical protein